MGCPQKGEPFHCPSVPTTRSLRLNSISGRRPVKPSPRGNSATSFRVLNADRLDRRVPALSVCAYNRLETKCLLLTLLCCKPPWSGTKCRSTDSRNLWPKYDGSSVKTARFRPLRRLHRSARAGCPKRAGAGLLRRNGHAGPRGRRLQRRHLRRQRQKPPLSRSGE